MPTFSYIPKYYIAELIIITVLPDQAPEKQTKWTVIPES